MADFFCTSSFGLTHTHIHTLVVSFIFFRSDLDSFQQLSISMHTHYRLPINSLYDRIGVCRVAAPSSYYGQRDISRRKHHREFKGRLINQVCAHPHPPFMPLSLGPPKKVKCVTLGPDCCPAGWREAMPPFCHPSKSPHCPLITKYLNIYRCTTCLFVIRKYASTSQAAAVLPACLGSYRTISRMQALAINHMFWWLKQGTDHSNVL